MKILVAEDDVLASTKLCNALKYREYDILGPARKGAEAIEICQSEAPDLAILDWDLADDVNGLAVAKELKAKFNIPVIFVTGRLDDEVKQQAIELNAFAFINKPFNDRNLLNAIDMAISRFAETQLDEEIENEDAAYKLNDKIFIKKNGRYLKVEIKDILFLEANRHYVIIHTDAEQILANANLSTMLAQVNHPTLVRVHRSYAVNMAQLQDFDDAFIHFPNKSIPFSKTYKEAFFNKLKLL